MSDHSSHDVPDDEPNGPYGVGCDCTPAEASPGRFARAVSGLAQALPLTVFAYVAITGQLDYGSGWAVIAGVAAAAAILGAPVITGFLLAAIYALLAIFVVPDDFGTGAATGTLSIFAVMSAAGYAVRAYTEWPYISWRGRHLTGRLRRDRLSREAEEGIGMAEAYLVGAADIMGPHTLARLQDPARKMLGLSGYGGAGKDTAAAELMFNNDYTRVSFADKLREFAYALNPLVVVRYTDKLYRDVVAGWSFDMTAPVYRRVAYLVDVFGWERAKYEVEDVRTLLQRVGTDAGRNVLGENVWVDAVMAALPDGPVVFTDTRFPNEAEAIAKAGGYVVRVTRPGVDAVNAHVSETALDDWPFDAHILNDTTPAAAREQMRNVEEVLFDPAEVSPA